MCGIAGCIGLERNLTEREKVQVQTMTDSLAHRGPDGEGLFWDQHVAFGHRRLAIIDLSESSNQPMTDQNGDVVLVFNGEIYNHAELRKELESEYEFRTDHSDTETIIIAYKKWGMDCLNRFRGMFAFALYDKPKRKVFLVRDRLGKKPLYYSIANGKLFFSSEINPLFNAGIISKKVNEVSIYNYLTFLTTPAPETFYRDVSKLEMGHYLQIGNNHVTKKCYWNVSEFINREVSMDFDTAREESESLLNKAMFYRNVSDVPVTLALSGGLDSSLNLHYSKQVNSSLLSATVAYHQTSEFDESKLAEKYSGESGVDYMEVMTDDEILRTTISDYLSIQTDMPAGDPNTILLYHLSKQMKQKELKVLMVGEGGDELGGYPIYLDLLREYFILKKYKGILRSLRPFYPFKNIKKLDCLYKGKIVSRRQIHGFYEMEKKNFWLKSREINSYDVLMGFMDEIRDDLEDSFLRKILNIEYKLRLPELILARIDYPTMASSVEARSPYMDHELIEFSASLDFKIKMRDGAKSLLKKIAEDKLPAYILNHPKVGFGMLLKPFFSQTLPVWYSKDLLENKAPVQQYISSDYLEYLFKSNKNGSKGSKLWHLYSLNRWLEKNTN